MDKIFEMYLNSLVSIKKFNNIDIGYLINTEIDRAIIWSTFMGMHDTLIIEQLAIVKDITNE